MRKIIITILCIMILSPFATFTAQAADTKSTSIAIPITTGLTGAANSTKSFTLDLPSGVASTSIKTGTLKYNGNNAVVGNISVVNGKLHLTLKGNERTESFPVYGYEDRWENNFISNVGNSIWRYSDGKRWQINNYIPESRTQHTFNVNAADSAVPSNFPPTTPVKTFSEPVNPNTATWFSASEEKVSFSSVLQSSIQIKHLDLQGGSGTISPLGDRYIVAYTVPTAFIKEEKVSDDFDKGAWVVGRLYHLKLPYYFKGEVKQTTYSYAGNVSFDYALQEGPSLTGLVVVNKPDPNPFKYANADVPVNLTLKGILSGYENSSNIAEWVFYAQEKESPSTLDTKKSFEKSKTSSQAFSKFKIPKMKVENSKDNYQQVYELRVTVRFSKPIETKEGKIDQLSEKLEATVEVYKGEPTVSFPPNIEEPPTPKGRPPVASIFANPIVKAGDELVANGSGSYDPDGDIIGYYFASEGANFVSYSQKGDLATLWYPSERVGQNSIGLTVVDKDMMIDSAGTFVRVIEPIPEALLEIGGTKKQNRKVTLIDKSTSPKHYPIKTDKTKITISAVAGAGGSNAAIKYSGSLNGIYQKDVLFREPGLYKATIYVENTLGYSATNEVTFEIVPDDPPVMYFSTPGRVYRDPQKGNKAIVTLDDLSYSPDGDIISRRVWEYRFDSDNDKSFADESWVVFSDANEHRLNLELSHVGRYEIRHTAYESFNQPTIDEFVTAADRRHADSSDQHIDEKIVEVVNLGPEGDWTW
ncbi:hypothetical protein H70357_06765 [Paenibacillus sp. FSL H7-0357]|uniref:hypothetical protein n=1 Tax=Paenibacillus sp. FSL H7-0357 TaxID=1536774 RepID=UPI0004F711B3|nr:hypothetical protein [Paenibacillus sp. FSL H7-0357]AIQ16407.1 hypothetical protein H70357_06765 [Paenibacillus sp. FSL H7-0357]